MMAEARATLHKFGEQLEAIELVLAAQRTIGQEVAEMFTTWDAKWTARHGAAYVFTRQRDAGTFKRLVQQLGVEELTRRVDVYFASREPFYVTHKHPLAIFASAVNGFTSTAKPSRAECDHVPRCPSQWDHAILSDAEQGGDQALVAGVKRIHDKKRGVRA